MRRPGAQQPVWALVLTAVASFLVALDALAVTTALPAIGADLGAGLTTRQWLVNAYALAFAAGIVPAAALGDRLGRRRMFVAGLALFTAASVGCALAPDAAWLLAWRAVQGLGAAVVTPLGLTILTSAVPPERRGTVLGLWGALGGLAVASGPVVGALLTQAAGWQAIFWANVPVGLAAIAIAPFRLAESYGSRRRPDLPGILLLSGAAGTVLAALASAGSSGWTAPGSALGLAAAAVLGTAFVARQRYAAQPLLAPRLVRAPGFAAALVTWVLMTATINAATFFVAQFFQETQGDLPLAAGLHLLPWTLAPLLVSPLAGALADRVGRRPVLVAGMLLQGIGLGWFALAAGVGTPYPRLAVPLLVAGLGIATAMPVAVAATLGAVPPEELGTASGATSTLQRLGGALGVALAATVFAAHGNLDGPSSFAAGVRPALGLAAVLSLLGAGTALALERSPGPVAGRLPLAGRVAVGR